MLFLQFIAILGVSAVIALATLYLWGPQVSIGIAVVGFLILQIVIFILKNRD